MTIPSYISPDIDVLYDQAPPDVLKLISSGEINTVTAILGKIYKIPIGSYVALSNVITFILVGALKPEDVVRGIVDILNIPEDEAFKLATDLDKTILEKVRISIMGKSPKDMVTLTFQEGRSPDELRKEILDTTKRDPVPLAMPVTTTPPTQTQAAPYKAPPLVTGSRSQLMEQLQILDTIPKDEEVSERLQKIQAQIANMHAQEDAKAQALQQENTIPHDVEIAKIPLEPQSAPYSKAPTRYNVDPYREAIEG
jgi:hypothetical protein